MIYAGYIVLALAGYRFFTVLLNLFFRQATPKVPIDENVPVSVLIPARNEAENIGLLLNDLQNIGYKNLEILVLNDDSTDSTGEIIDSFAQKDARIKQLYSNKLPNQWLGKNFACNTLAQEAKGKYFLFIDADVRLKHSAVEDALAHVIKHKLVLLSVFPQQIMRTRGEKITVPIMHTILLSLLPLIFVRISPFSSHSAANGQFMFFNAEVYRKMNPHQKFKSNAVEDILTAQYFKRNKLKIACITGNKNIECRMYKGYSEAVHGFAKNVLMFFGNSAVVAILFFLLTTFGFMLLIPTPKLLLSYLFLIISTRILVSVVAKQSVSENLKYMFLQQLSLGYFIYHAILKRLNKTYEWKGRKIY
ncbi:MAG TPA: glycosyl transferase family 2 [Bacteroidales bacterium]|nr:glycosyl transferase family 2 [Bacteroidales bacterium]